MLDDRFARFLKTNCKSIKNMSRLEQLELREYLNKVMAEMNGQERHKYTDLMQMSIKGKCGAVNAALMKLTSPPFEKGGF